MSDTALFLMGVLATGLCILFIVISVTEMKRIGRKAEDESRRRE